MDETPSIGNPDDSQSAGNRYKESENQVKTNTVGSSSESCQGQNRGSDEHTQVLYTLAEAAMILRVSKPTLQLLVRKGRLLVTHVTPSPRGQRIWASEIDRFIKAGGWSE